MAGEGSQAKPIRLFYSYSHKDEDLRLKLQDHLAALKWSGMIAKGNDRDIEAGREWEKETTIISRQPTSSFFWSVPASSPSMPISRSAHRRRIAVIMLS